MTHLNNDQGSNEEVSSEHTVCKNEAVKTPKTLPSKTEVNKAFSKPKSNILFTEKDITNIKSGLGFLDLNLQTDDIEIRTNVVKSIEALIDSMHTVFSKDFKAYKKALAKNINKTFLTDFFKQCEDRLVNEKNNAQKGNELLKTQVIDQTIEFIKDKINDGIDIEMLRVLFTSKKSLNSKKTLHKLLTEKK